MVGFLLITLSFKANNSLLRSFPTIHKCNKDRKKYILLRKISTNALKCDHLLMGP